MNFFRAVPIASPANCPRCKKPNEKNLPFCAGCAFDIQYGTLGRPTKAKCLYCDNRSTSEEHIFGNWLARRHPRPKSPEWRRHLVRPENLGDETSPLHKVVDGDGTHPYLATVPNVCPLCNNGWMSAVHIAAKSHVIELADGGWPSLSDETRLALARWVAMICVNIQSYTRNVYASELQLQDLKNGGMPDGFRVSIMRMEDALSGGYHAHRPRTVTGLGAADEITYFASTFL